MNAHRRAGFSPPAGPPTMTRMTRRLAVLLASLAVGLSGMALGADPAAAAGASMCSASNEGSVPTPNDLDDDCVDDRADNCYGVPNPDQRNSDSDPAGDACDADDDQDGVLDAATTAGRSRTLTSSTTTGTRYGNACYKDTDGDGHIDEEDNCKRTRNADQTGPRRRRDRRRVRCRRRPRRARDARDNCPRNANKEQADADGNGLGDACDPNSSLATEFVAPASTAVDTVKDRIAARVTLSSPRCSAPRDARGGMPASVRCSEACSVSARLRSPRRRQARSSARRVVASGEAALEGPGHLRLPGFHEAVR